MQAGTRYSDCSVMHQDHQREVHRIADITKEPGTHILLNATTYTILTENRIVNNELRNLKHEQQKCK